MALITKKVSSFDIDDALVINNNSTVSLNQIDVISGGVRTTVWIRFRSKSFEYTGDVQTFVVPVSGLYLLEVWGAQGGYDISSTGLGHDGVGEDDPIHYGAAGGYSYGNIRLNAGDELYICIGGKGLDCEYNQSTLETGGYNGGGNSVEVFDNIEGGGGGGATHIAKGTNRGVLANYDSYRDEIIIVAGGGGGCVTSPHLYDNGCSAKLINIYAGTGGGLFGGPSGAYKQVHTSGESCDKSHDTGWKQDKGATQDSGYAFGQGGNLSGGGWYGGPSGGAYGCGRGGSGYIGGVFNGSMVNGQRGGNGYATITLLAQSYEFDYTGGIQTFRVPVTGTYLLQVWGAQGGSIAGNAANTLGGYGGYSSGNVYLTAGTVLYVAVGGAGAENCVGGFNGGGSYSSGNANGGGGGCTHIGTFNSTLVAHGSTSGLYIVAGGGGGAGRGDILTDPYSLKCFHGGYGGGTNGETGYNYLGEQKTESGSGAGGTQTAGGTGANGDDGGSFGQGGSPHKSWDGACGGGGLYGGAAGWSYNGGAGGGGGSGYIGGVTGGSMQNGVKVGNGYARIILVSAS